MSWIVFSLILITMLLNTVAQIFLKAGMIKIGTFSFTWENLFPILAQVSSSSWIIFGVAIYASSVLTWLMVLSRVPVSIAYPMTSLAYITSAIAACYFFGENLTPIRIAGIFVIILGVYLVGKS